MMGLLGSAANRARHGLGLALSNVGVIQRRHEKTAAGEISDQGNPDEPQGLRQRELIADQIGGHHLGGTGNRFVALIDRYIAVRYLQVLAFTLLSVYLVYALSPIKKVTM